MNGVNDERLMRLAQDINDAHDGSPATRAVAPDYRFLGLKGEIELARLLGNNPDLSVRRDGDGGVDNYFWYRGRVFKADAKVSRLPHLGMLCKRPLRADVYVFFEYPGMKCWGWTWRSVVRQQPIVDKGHDIPSHNVETKFLRDISELLSKIERGPHA